MRRVTLTGRGWAVAAMGLALGALGPVFGAAALQQLGLGLVAMPVLALAVVAIARHRVRVIRRLSSDRVGPHENVNVSIQLTNQGKASAPLLLLEDDLPAGIRGDARRLVKGVRAGESATASMSLTALQRGKYEIGPLRISYLDPFALARRSETRGDPHGLMVHPRTHHLELPRDGRDGSPVARPASRQPTAARGEEFFTLRDYVEGDDLRKVHWSSTAKRGKLMLKQEEIPWHERATIVLDDGHHRDTMPGDGASFEQAVEAAASLARLFETSGYSYSLAGAIAPGIPTGRGPDHYRRCLDFLAETSPATRPSRKEPLVVRLAELSARSLTEEALIVLTGTLSPSVAAAVTRCRRSFRRLAVMSFAPRAPTHSFASPAPGDATRERPAALLAGSGIRSVVVGPDQSLVAAWEFLWRHRHGEGDRAWHAEPTFA